MTWRLYQAQPPLRHEERDAVLEVIGRIDDPDAKLLAAVVMDDHVHALVHLGPALLTGKLIHTWKSVSSHRLARNFGRIPPVWQRDYFDRNLRSDTRIDSCRRYILTNPGRRWPGIRRYRWVIGS